MARKLCTSFVDPTMINTYTACYLIPLDKNPGVRPIDIGEVLCRIVGKAILTIFYHDILEVTGTIQLCTGQTSGAEAAVHAIHHPFEDDSCEAALLINATNAFN